jgi:hypothetical protein
MYNLRNRTVVKREPKFPGRKPRCIPHKHSGRDITRTRIWGGDGGPVVHEQGYGYSIDIDPSALGMPLIDLTARTTAYDVDTWIVVKR